MSAEALEGSKDAWLGLRHDDEGVFSLYLGATAILGFDGVHLYYVSSGGAKLGPHSVGLRVGERIGLSGGYGRRERHQGCARESDGCERGTSCL